MCQLCFINLNNKVLNKAWAYASIYANSKKTHEDGFGISSGENIYKHENSAWNLTNWTEHIKFITNKPVMTHVRKASFVKGNKLVDDAKYNHPFRTKSLILMHNGTLLKKDAEKFPNYKLDKMVDSEVFLRVLSNIYNKNGHNLQPALQRTMEDFYGKFAFIIYEIIKDKYTIVRGKTALLHYLPLNIKKDDEIIPTGFVVNTEKEGLYDSLCIATNFLINSNNVQINWEDENKEEVLEAESIYEIEKLKVNKVGELKENSEPVITTTWAKSNLNNRDYTTQSFSTEDLRIARELFAFKNKWRISLEYLDLLFYHTFGTGLLCSNQEEYTIFVNRIIPSLNKFAKKEEDFLIKVWKEIREEKGVGDVYLTKKFKIPFPYFVVNKAEDLYTYLEPNIEVSKVEGEIK